MRLLLDTSVLLWWLDGDPALQEDSVRAISAPENVVYVSSVSTWEIVLKKSLGKLSIPGEWADVLGGEKFRRLPVTWEHTFKLEELPALHKDPFDRLLIAQAMAENLAIVTRDEIFARYGVTVIRA